jgi:hypothetical protein
VRGGHLVVRKMRTVYSKGGYFYAVDDSSSRKTG